SIPATKAEEFPKFTRSQDEHGEFMHVRFSWIFKNAGKRPGHIMSVHTIGEVHKVCTEHPYYDPAPEPGTAVINLSQTGPTRVFLIPDSTVTAPSENTIPIDQWNEIDKTIGTLHYCVYSLIEYQ